MCCSWCDERALRATQERMRTMTRAEKAFDEAIERLCLTKRTKDFDGAWEIASILYRLVEAERKRADDETLSR